MPDFIKKLHNFPDTQVINYIFMTILLVLAFLIGFFKITDYDIWWHMKTGEYILAHGIPATDPFSFTAYGNPWVTHEWLAEVIFYLLYKLGGLNFLIFFKAAISALIAIVIYYFGRRQKISAPLTSATAIFAVAGMSYMMYARPHIFTYLFLALLMAMLFKSAHSERAFRLERWLYIPLIFLAWANIHAGFLLGLAIYWIVVANEVFRPGDSSLDLSSRLKRFVFPALLATGVCLINPNGLKIFTYTIAIAGNPTFKSTISEWVSPIYLGSGEWLAKVILGLATAASIVAAIFHLRRRPDIAVIVISVGLSAWLAMRNIQNHVIALAFALLAIRVSTKSKRRKASLYLGPVLALVCVAWIAAWFLLIRDYQRQDGRLGMGVKEGLVPVEAAAFLNKVNYQGNILNILQDGGYLIWAGYPRWKVFVDGRLDVYGEKWIENYRKVASGAIGSLETLNELNVNAAVLPMPPEMGEIRVQLATDSLWSLVYFDDYYLVYMRHVQDNQETIKQWGYRTINPLVNGYGLDNPGKLDLFLAETKRALYANTKSSLANAAYGFGLQQKGEYLPAANAFKTAVLLKPGLIDFYRYVARLYVSANMIDSAKAWYARALVVRPTDPWVYYDLGMLYVRLADYDRAETYLNKALRLDPKVPAAQALERVKALRGSKKPPQ